MGARSPREAEMESVDQESPEELSPVNRASLAPMGIPGAGGSPVPRGGSVFREEAGPEEEQADQEEEESTPESVLTEPEDKGDPSGTGGEAS